MIECEVERIFFTVLLGGCTIFWLYKVVRLKKILEQERRDKNER